MMSTPSRLMHSSTIFAPGSFTVASIHLGAPTWPPHSSSEGGYAPLGLPRHARGAPAKPWHPSILRQVPLARLPLLEALQQALGLLEVALGVDVLGLQVEHDLPLGDGLGQLLLAEESDAFLVVAVDDLAPRPRQQTCPGLVVGLQLRPLGGGAGRGGVLLFPER